ncbi:hypothetical protein GCQ56_13020 [Marinifilum sp. N1E240]|uniref:hypothetical protein n=1 Tax=Marinifilum sp. N1E240 TaxID=2608082 RepID=UPI00128BD086|nr:hypothetical protein [Marinifilum sp. N1E240]MPQ47927.1 hypothetical protein [Marinifilum sp. N1E240]|eukprot:TRINITY_DN776068_c0_g1_i1.p1 TRINITY_DN776068_c0_g1~~TRINITY_DN776068_c0_g1_i1.p1  ORF type:complete len:230 (+),score=62.78 TRINITY_DN776068_c0_g1_i1:61-750(+)
MKNKLLVLSLVSLMLSSCVVSKKKYEELEYAKRRSDAKVSALDKENSKKKKQIGDLNSKLDKTLAEFNEMKNSMAESNAMKNSEIDGLSTELMGLASDTTALKTRLDETLEKYNKIINQNSNNESKIADMMKQVQDLKSESAKLSEEIKTAGIEAEWDKKKLKTEKKKTIDAISRKDNEIAELKKQIEERDGKLSWLRKVKVKNEAEIERLTNQVKLYKAEYEKAIGGK